MQSMADEFQFPLSQEKLRVLVVDDDPVCVKILSRMLNHCNYQVTEVAKASEAVETLTKNPKGFDMVITDTRNDIEIVQLIVEITKMESLPVVLVSGLEDTSTLIQGVLEGADEILSKPVSLAKIKNLWQHVYRRTLTEPPPTTTTTPTLTLTPPCDDDQSEQNEDGNGNLSDETEEEMENKRPKRMRVKWSGSLQEKFSEAVLQLGGPEKAVPKKIMEMMNVPDVSRESVASHLQKYRKQKKPLVAPQNDSNFVVSSSSSSSSSSISPFFSPFRPPMSHRFGYHHHHIRPNVWHFPKPEPRFIQQKQPMMLPPLPEQINNYSSVLDETVLMCNQMLETETETDIQHLLGYEVEEDGQMGNGQLRDENQLIQVQGAEDGADGVSNQLHYRWKPAT